MLHAQKLHRDSDRDTVRQRDSKIVRQRDRQTETQSYSKRDRLGLLLTGGVQVLGKVMHAEAHRTVTANNSRSTKDLLVSFRLNKLSSSQRLNWEAAVVHQLQLPKVP